MKIEINNFVSIVDANQDFSRVARFVDEKGSAVILKSNIPRYIILHISQFQQEGLPVIMKYIWCPNAFLKKTATPMRGFQNKGIFAHFSNYSRRREAQ